MLCFAFHFLLQLEDVVVEVPMPKSVQNCNLVASQGKYSFDPTTKVLSWDVGKIELGKPPTLRGSVRIFSNFFLFEKIDKLLTFYESILNQFLRTYCVYVDIFFAGVGKHERCGRLN
jgi:hypothetical protein